MAAISSQPYLQAALISSIPATLTATAAWYSAHRGRKQNHDDAEAFAKWATGARAFGAKFWEVLGERRAPRIVFEHPGEATIPTSIFLVDNAGMVTICAGTTGYNADIDLRYLWMRQKRLQGSHFANTEQCAALNALVASGAVDPALSRTFPLEAVGEAHGLMHENRHPPGNMAILVNARSGDRGRRDGGGQEAAESG